MKLQLVAAATIFVCSAAAAVDLPDMPVSGSRFADLDQSSYKCDPSNAGLLMCRRAGAVTDRIGGCPVREIVVFYRDGIQVRSVIKLDEENFSEFADTLLGVLGDAVEGIEFLNAGMGGAFENRYYLWKRDGHSWMLEQFFERIIHSGLWIVSDAEMETLMAERERTRVRGVRNL